MKLSLILLLSFFETSIYSYQINAADGSTINFNDFHGKNILIVNIATNSTSTSQLLKLEELYQLYKDSLVIVAFPSNSFGSEQRTDPEILSFCRTNYNTHFLIAAKNAVVGDNQQAVYQWICNMSNNGVINNTIQKDFQKYLIDKNGSLIGLFSSSTDPMDNKIRNAITASNQ